MNQEKPKAVIVYHRVDYDGIFSGLLAGLGLTEKFKKSGISRKLYGFNYGDELDYELLDSADLLILTDISFPAVDMIKYKDKMLWIDHHVTAINESGQAGYEDIPGIREAGISAAELTWQFFFPKYICPLIIKFIGAYDVWNHDSMPWEDTMAVQLGLRSRYGMSITDVKTDLKKLLTLGPSNFSESEVYKTGKIIYEYKKQADEVKAKSFSFPVTIGGKWKGIAILNTEFGSSVFDSIPDKSLIYVVANVRGDKGISISMYTDPKEGPVDFSCGEYMKKNYSGGGHKGAAGGKLEVKEFIRLIEKREV